MPERRDPRPTHTDPQVPPGLAGAAAWCWRVLVVAAAFLALVLLLSRLAVAVLPVAAALLLTALLHPVVAFLRRHSWPRALATWGTLALAAAVIGAIGWFAVGKIVSGYGAVVRDADGVLSDARAALQELPGAGSIDLAQVQGDVVSRLRDNASTIARGLVQVGTLLGETVTVVIVTFFLTFFFLDDGDRIWGWLTRLFPRGAQRSVHGAGYRAWHVLSGWIVGTAIVALFHGVVIGVVLVLLGAPLAVPLAVLVLVGSFLPIVGAVVFGGLAVLVTLLSLGVVPAVVVLAVLVVENLVEAHLLQPFVVGRAVRLHPVAIILALTAGGVVGGVFGAVLAIPLVAASYGAVMYLTGVQDVRGKVLRGGDRMAPHPPADQAPLTMVATEAVPSTLGHGSSTPDAPQRQDAEVGPDAGSGTGDGGRRGG